MHNADKLKRRAGNAINEAEQEAERLFDESRRLLTLASDETDPVKRRALSRESHELGERSAGLKRAAAKAVRSAVSMAIHR